MALKQWLLENEKAVCQNRLPNSNRLHSIPLEARSPLSGLIAGPSGLPSLWSR